MVEAIMEKYREMEKNQPIWSWANALERGERKYRGIIKDKYEEGKEEGEEKGQVKLLCRMLYKKYNIDASTWLSTLTLEELSKVSDSILDCTSYAELQESVKV